MKTSAPTPPCGPKMALYRMGKGLFSLVYLLKLVTMLLSQGVNNRNQPAERRLWAYRAPLPVNDWSFALEYLEL
jgi:hypothetical protein